MEIFHLECKNTIDPESEIHYSVITTLTNQLYPHYHDFFEIFFVVKGKVLLRVYGIDNIYEEGALVFIRPNEIHTKEHVGNSQHINLAFPIKAADDLFYYLGEGFSKALLLNSKFPPSIFLSKTERNVLYNKFEKLHTISTLNKKVIKMELRVLLMELFIRFSKLNYTYKETIVPMWMEPLIK